MHIVLCISSFRYLLHFFVAPYLCLLTVNNGFTNFLYDETSQRALNRLHINFACAQHIRMLQMCYAQYSSGINISKIFCAQNKQCER